MPGITKAKREDRYRITESVKRWHRTRRVRRGRVEGERPGSLIEAFKMSLGDEDEGGTTPTPGPSA